MFSIMNYCVPCNETHRYTRSAKLLEKELSFIVVPYLIGTLREVNKFTALEKEEMCGFSSVMGTTR